MRNLFIIFASLLLSIPVVAAEVADNNKNVKDGMHVSVHLFSCYAVKHSSESIGNSSEYKKNHAVFRYCGNSPDRTLYRRCP